MDGQNQSGIPMPQMPQVPADAMTKSGFKKYWPYMAGGLAVVIAGIGTAWVLSGKIMGKVAGSTSGGPIAKIGSRRFGLF